MKSIIEITIQNAQELLTPFPLYRPIPEQVEIAVKVPGIKIPDIEPMP